MEQLLEQLKTQNPSSTTLAQKLEAVIRIINEVEPSVFARVKLDPNGNPIRIG